MYRNSLFSSDSN